MIPSRRLLPSSQSKRSFGLRIKHAPPCPVPRTRIAHICKAALSTDALVGAGLSPEEAHRVLAACPRLSDPANEALLESNLSFLKTIYKPHLVNKLLSRTPEVFTTQLAEWHQFLTGYGLDDEGVWRVLRFSPGLLLRRPNGGDGDGAGGGAANTPYNAGAAIMFLKSYGWTDEEVVARLLPCYPEVLAATPEQLQAAVEFLRSRSFDEEAIARMVRVFPPLLVGPYNESLLELIDRIRASAHNKYVVSGSYHV